MASPPLEFLTGKLVSLIENELSLLGGYPDEREEIKRELRIMKAFLADAERKGTLSEVEKAWVEDVRDASLQVEDFIEDFTYEMNKQRGWGPYARAFRQTVFFPMNCWDKHQMATKMQKLIGRIKAIPEMNLRYGVDRIEGMPSNHDHLNWVKIHGESSLFFEDDELVGIEDAKEKLLGWLLSEKPRRTVIAVVGMGGSGKTTLVANTFNSQILKKHFDCYAWITVSQTYQIEDLLRAIINELFRAVKQDVPQDLSNMSYRQYMEILVHYLRLKRYVIVLDDVWDINLWSNLYKALPDGAVRSRVILTTRKEDIALSSFGVESHVHHVPPLNEEGAWDLFSKKAFSSWPHSYCPPELEDIARDLIGKCNGLPLGVATLGALMSTKRLKLEWREVYSNLSWELSNNPTLELVKSISLLSFNELPYRLKHCFLYFCMFPEDYVIHSERLVSLWMAEGFVEKVGGQNPRLTAENYIAQLTCRCMLQVVGRQSSGKAKKFKMHDLLRELALSISKTEKFCIIYNQVEDTIDESFVPHRLSTIQSNYGDFRMHKDLSKVRTFFTFPPKMGNASAMEKLPSGFKKLRVLDVQDVPIIQIPIEVVKCFNLKYLNLRGTKVKELPDGIGNLHNLETVDIRDSEIRLLPVGIAKLQNLRHLLMYHYNARDYMAFHYLGGTQAPFNICKLKNLQVLDSIEVGGMVMKQLGDMTQLTSLGLTNVREADDNDLCKALESMKLVEKLIVNTSNEDEVLCLDALTSAPPLLKVLHLCGRLENLPRWFHFLESLTVLSLRWSRFQDSRFLQDIQALPNLTRLHLLNAHVGNQLMFHGDGFRKLTILGIVNSPELKVVIIERGVMPSLERLDILGCMELKQLPEGIEHLTCLQTLFLHGVPNELAEQISKEGSLDHSKVKHIPNISIFTKTQWEFVISHMKNNDAGASSKTPAVARQRKSKRESKVPNYLKDYKLK